MKTYSAKSGDVQRKWFVVDAASAPLGRMATQVATLLRGKHKPMYTPHIDTGDHVIVINADQLKLTGLKMDQKILLQSNLNTTKKIILYLTHVIRYLIC